MRKTWLLLLALQAACSPASRPPPPPSESSPFRSEDEAVGYFRSRYAPGTARQSILSDLAGRSVSVDERDRNVLVLSVPADSRGETRLVPAAGGGMMPVATQSNWSIRFRFDAADRLLGVEAERTMVP